MNTGRYTEIIANSEVLKKEETSELKSIIEKYPFFQSARALYLKGLKQHGSFRYNHELKITASYTTDRTVLFDFITSKSFEKHTDIHQEISEKIKAQENSNEKEAISEKTNDLNLGTPIHFSKSETHSFQEWLKISTQTPISRNKVNESNEEIDKEFLINRFIENNPKISTLRKEEESKITVPEIKPDHFLMTETLAKVYLEQKKFSNAIKAYEILSLKYPEKSGFFADQIKKIKILQNIKS